MAFFKLKVGNYKLKLNADHVSMLNETKGNGFSSSSDTSNLEHKCLTELYDKGLIKPRYYKNSTIYRITPRGSAVLLFLELA